MLFPCPVFCAAPPPPVFLRRTPAVASRSAQGEYEGRGQCLDRSRAGSRVRSKGIARPRENHLRRGRTGYARGTVRERVALARHGGQVSAFFYERNAGAAGKRRRRSRLVRERTQDAFRFGERDSVAGKLKSANHEPG